MSGFQCLLSGSRWDAVQYVRARDEDLQTGIFQAISDDSYRLYAEAVAEEFSRWSPLGDFVLGSPGANPITSPINTVAFQQRYVLSPSFLSGLGLPAVMEVTDVLYRLGVSILVGADIAFFLLIPSSPLGRFQLDPSSPTERFLRNNFLNELDHYGVGFWTVERDASGNPCIDLWPVPQQSGLPILVRYAAQHSPTQLNDGQDSVWYQTVPEHRKKQFGDLLFAQVLEQEAARTARRVMTRSGLIARQSAAVEMRNLAMEIRDRVEQSLGSTTPVIARSLE